MRFTIVLRALPLAAAFAAALVSGTGLAQITAVPPAIYQPKLTAKFVAPTTLVTPATAPKFAVTLLPPATAEVAGLRNDSAGKGRPFPVGFGRSLPAGGSPLPLESFPWQAVADGGMAARMEIASPGAAAIRLAVMMQSTDPDVMLRFAGSDHPEAVFGPYPGNKVAETGMYWWSPVLEGAVATMEIYLPPGVSPDAVHIAVPLLSHWVVAGKDIPKTAGVIPTPYIGRSAACEVDVTCATPTAALTNQAKAVAWISMVDSYGESAICTGTLINDSTQSFTPYLFVANHCVDSQSAASTLDTFWFFDAVSCNVHTVPPYVHVAGGAMLLGRSEDYDWSLVRLNNPPPAGAVFSAWRAEQLAAATAISVVHHPQGDLKKFSQGTILGTYRNSDLFDFNYDDGSSDPIDSRAINASFTMVQYMTGSTEAGSSGSGLLTLSADGSFYELRGGLFAGGASCFSPTLTDIYSRFDVALPLLTQYLTPDAPNPKGLAVVVEFYNAGLDEYFTTADPVEINDLDTGVHSGWVRTGIRFLAYADPALAPTGALPVCRFYNPGPPVESHYYATGAAQCAQVQAMFGMPNGPWFYERHPVAGEAAFYIQLPDTTTGACPANTHPIYEFNFPPLQIQHRYTPEQVIRQHMINSQLGQEGYGNPPDQVAMCSPNS